MSATTFETVDERTGTLMVGAGMIDVEQFGKWLAASGQEGYEVYSTASVEGGTQRDPYSVGIKIKLRKT